MFWPGSTKWPHMTIIDNKANMPFIQKNPDNNIPEVKKLKKTNEPSEKESDAVRIIRLCAYVTHREGRNISRQYWNDYTYDWMYGKASFL